MLQGSHLRPIQLIMNRTKKTKFNLTLDSGERIYFDYSNQLFDITKGDPWVEMRMDCTIAELRGALWSNDYGKHDYMLHAPLLAALKVALRTSISNEVRSFLLMKLIFLGYG